MILRSSLRWSVAVPQITRAAAAGATHSGRRVVRFRPLSSCARLFAANPPSSRSSSDQIYQKQRSSEEPPLIGMPLVNTLSTAQSPYLRAHRDNPVAWQQWTDSTLTRAKRENKPVFLSIGYHTCHWCHVMNDESFSSEIIAAVLNEHFIPIKLDREERPDVDAVYMMYLQAMSGGRGGWPLNVFLAPDTLDPIFGGTYWPGPWEEVSSKTGRTRKPQGPEFKDVLLRIHQLWTQDEDKCRHAGADAVRQLRDWTMAKTKADSSPLRPGILCDAYEYFVDRYDSVHGGFGEAPKFPQPTMLSLLVRMHQYMRIKEKVDLGDDRNAADMAIATLEKIAKGGIHDLIGNGFARYSVTADWSVPHFEKMLYDQAMLLNAYLDAWLFNKEANKFALDAVGDIATYLTNGPLTHPQGGCYSAEDADSIAPDNALTKREGAYYVWTYDEFFKVLGRVPGDIAAAHWGVSEFGNVDPQFDLHHELQGQNVLTVTMELPELSGVFGKSIESLEELLADCRDKLRAHREATRMKPSVDTKIVACWNGLAIGALARSGAAVLDVDPNAGAKWLEAAESAAEFIKANMYDETTHRLTRVYLDGPGTTPGMCEDYAYLIAGLLDLYEATFDPGYLIWARNLQETQNSLFWDESESGYFSAANDATNNLILRIKSGADAVEPSANAVSVSNLLRFSAMLGDEHLEDMALGTLDSFGKDIITQPYVYCGMLPSVVAANEGMRTIVLVVGKDANEDSVNDTVASVRSVLLPNTTVVLLRAVPRDDNDCHLQGWLVQQDDIYKTLLAAHEAKEHDADVTVYICRHKECGLPITGKSELMEVLERESNPEK
ncbi:hypothetical protein V1506DRAFT_542818 [Lipomyces tetrasporus]